MNHRKDTIPIQPYFVVLKNETDKLKSDEVENKPASERPIFYRIIENNDSFKLEPIINSVTYKKFIEKFQSIVPELLRTSTKLGPIISLNTVTEEYFISFDDLDKVSEYLKKVGNNNPFPYFAIFVCSIALVITDIDKKYANEHFLGSKEKVFLFVYDNYDKTNDLEDEIIEFQERVMFCEKYKKYSVSTFDNSIYDWVNELEKYPVEELQANRMINIENNLFNV